jgi:hypothetical protein
MKIGSSLSARGNWSRISWIGNSPCERKNIDPNGIIKRWGKDGNQIGQPITTDQARESSLVALTNGELASAGRNMNTCSHTSIKRWGNE